MKSLFYLSYAFSASTLPLAVSPGRNPTGSASLAGRKTWKAISLLLAAFKPQTVLLCPNVYLPHNRDGLSIRSTKKVSHLNKEIICHHISTHRSVKETNSSEIIAFSSTIIFHTKSLMVAKQLAAHLGTTGYWYANHAW